MEAIIISVGTEVLTGDVVNTNASYFSKELFKLGIRVKKHLTIDDEFEEIKKITRAEMTQNGFLLFTGGLGPTLDDMTKEAVLEALGEKLEQNKESYDRLNKYFSYNSEAVEKNLKQVYFSKNCLVLPNNKGTADGFYLEKDGYKFAVLPGPPRENGPMYEDYLKSILEEEIGGSFVSRDYRIDGIGEWYTENAIQDLENGIDKVATYAKKEGLFIRVTLNQDNYQNLEERFAYYENIFKERFKEHYTCQGLMTAEKVLAREIMEKKISVSTAESITGGMIVSKLINISGISEFLERSFVCYSDKAKSDILGVDPGVLEKYTAVSKETLKEMLNGLEKITSSDLVIATTGYAGPGGENPGLVYYGAKYKGKYSLIEERFTGSRNTVRARAANMAMINAYRLIK